MNVLGIQIGHDASACLVRDGEVIADAQEERFGRIKHQYGVPFEAIEYCLKAGDIPLDELDAVAFAERNPGKIHNEIVGIDLPPQRKTLRRLVRELDDNIRGVVRPSQEIPVYWKRFPLPRSCEVCFVEHHLAHAASAYYTSGLSGRTLIVTTDGVGDGISMAVWRGEDGRIEPLVKYGPEGSLGWFYSNVTEALGWWHGDGEGKTMGLAPYGDYRKCQGILSGYHPKYQNGRLVERHRFGPVNTWTEGGAYQWHLEEAKQIKALAAQLGGEHIAAEAQRVLEEQMAEVILPWLQIEKTRALCCAGGVFLNVKMNQRIWYTGQIERHHIFPNCGDGGLAVGAALYAYHQMVPFAPVGLIDHILWGPEFSDEQIWKRLRECRLTFRRVDDAAFWTAQGLAEGKIIAWFQGRMESGPRALGSRSILMSSARPEHKDVINAKVKFREAFRPFCPSMISEAAPEYLDRYRLEPYMVTSFNVQPGKRERIPAVVHVDDTVRPQTVRKDIQPLYWRLIKEFGNLTGDPVILNTSFNVKGEPIVCSPSEAIRCFYATGIDALVMGSFVLEK